MEIRVDKLQGGHYAFLSELPHLAEKSKQLSEKLAFEKNEKKLI